MDSTKNIKNSIEGYSDLTVILPTLNEESNIGKMLHELARQYRGCSVIIADDGSDDSTQWVVDTFRKKENRINVYFLDRDYKEPKGLTASVLDAFSLVRTKYFVVMDADFQHPPEKIEQIAKKLRRGADLVIARRDILMDFPLHRRFISKIATGLAQFALKGRVRCSDPLSGFFGGRTDSLKNYFLDKNRFQQEGLKILFDLLKKLPPNFCFDDIEYEFGPRAGGQSKLGFKQFLSFIWGLWKNL